MKIFIAKSLSLYIINCLIIVGQAEGSDRGFSKADIDAFCATHSHKPVSGTQPNGKKADSEVLHLQPGKYGYPDQGALLLFADGHYLLQLPVHRNGIHGMDGDDLLASGGIVGGCSKEQLSEALQNNKLQASSLRLLKRYQ